MSASAKVGESLPIGLKLYDSNSAAFVQASVYDDAGSLLSTLSLVHVAQGFYLTPSSFPMPDKPFISVVYVVYTDAGFTTKDSRYVEAAECFIREPIDALITKLTAGDTAVVSVDEESVEITTLDDQDVTNPEDEGDEVGASESETGDLSVGVTDDTIDVDSGECS